VQCKAPRNSQAYPTVDVENLVAIINPYRVSGHKPTGEIGNPVVEEIKISCDEEQELNDMMSEEGMPPPATCRVFVLKDASRR